MNIRYSFVLIVVVSLFVSCDNTPVSPSSRLTGSFSKASIPPVYVNVLNAEGHVLLAGTNDGLFRKELAQPNSWTYAPLGIDSTREFYGGVRDIVMWNEQEMMASVDYPDGELPASKKSKLFKSSDGGHTWNSVPYTYPKFDNFGVDIIELGYNNKKIFGSIGPIGVSVDSGKTWAYINNDFGDGFVFGEFLKVSELHPGVIWAGGQNPFFRAFLYKSYDGGKTWQYIDFANGTAYDLIIHPQYKNHVLVALEGGIIKSINAVKSCCNISLSNIAAYTLARSARNPRIVYASGFNENETLFFAASSDFGETWKIVEMQNSPVGLHVNDIISVMVNGQEVLYLGTNKGVYTYTFEE